MKGKRLKKLLFKVAWDSFIIAIQMCIDDFIDSFKRKAPPENTDSPYWPFSEPEKEKK